ncbi:PAS domain S-box protein [Methanosalsum natronophilum]|uniref:PAS domain S-box protein n=1 Tax=Methanosalsum natronophilum TaxID=768733 RepID=A0A424Z3H9_9EURY|nr:MAG: PAS domain S-box protein [Methanosalsum natronophilum]
MNWDETPLKLKLILYITIAVLFIMASSTAIIVSIVTTQKIDIEYSRSTEISQNYANQFNADMRENMAIPNTVARSLERYSSDDRFEINQKLEHILRENPRLIGVYVGYEPDAFDGNDLEYVNADYHDETGRFLPFWNRIGGEVDVEPLIDYDTEDYYQLPKQMRTDVVTEPYLYQGELIVSFVSPIIVDDEFKGIAGVDVSLDYIDDSVHDIQVLENGYAMVVSNSGTLLSHPQDKNAIGTTNIMDLHDEPVYMLLADINEGISGHIEVNDPITGKKSIIFYEPVDMGNFAFILSIPKDEMLADAIGLRDKLIIISTLAVIFMGSMGYLIALSITRPIQNIVDSFGKVSTDVSKGKLDSRADTDVAIDFKDIPIGLNEILSILEDYASKLKESNKTMQEMRVVINSSQVVVFLWLPEDKWPVEVVSDNITQFGYQPEEFTSGKLLYADIVHPEDLHKVEKDLDELVAQHTYYNGTKSVQKNKIIDTIPEYFTSEYRIITKSGDVRWVDERTLLRLDQNGTVTYLQGIILDITDRKQAEDALLNIEKVRKKEIHHRVKNNLQVISSMLYLESEHFSDPEVIESFKNSQNRVRSMALIHEEIYKSEDMRSVDFTDYVNKLGVYLLEAYNIGNGKIQLNLDIEKVYLSIDTSIPLGMIVNELVSNSLKHAFDPAENGQIDIVLKSKEDNYLLLVSDDGKGFPSHVDFRNTDSLGLQLVNTLVDQLDGTIDLESDDGSTQFEITFREINKV